MELALDRYMIENMKLQRTPSGEKIYTGLYHYFSKGELYCDEEFAVYRDSQKSEYHFFANQYVRVATGGILHIYLDYRVNNNFIPHKVIIQKNFGEERVREIFYFDSYHNILKYRFLGKKGRVDEKMEVSHKFSISTPCACVSMLHLKSKKEDATSKNYYQTVTSFNHWVFEKKPCVQTLVMEKSGSGYENIQIDGNTVHALTYHLFDGEEVKREYRRSKQQFLKVYLSKYLAIPYLMESRDQTKIQIKYLNNHESQRDDPLDYYLGEVG